MNILGISGLYHDSAATLVKDGQIIAAAQEERFTRIKHDSSLPKNAIKYCLDTGEVEKLDAVVFYDDPALTANRYVANLQYLGNDNQDFLELSFRQMIGEKLWVHKSMEDYLKEFGLSSKVYATKHHVSHAASAFFPSPFEQAAIITIDGVGEWSTTTIGYGDGNQIKLMKEITYPDSIGLLYSAFTYFCGFKVNSGDYKLMGLAPYGEPIYYDLIKKELIDIKEDGSYKLNMKYFDYQYGRGMTNTAFEELFGGPRRLPETQITKREMDMAASVQKVIEEVVILLAMHAKKLVGDKTSNLVMAGGVALNCVANGVLAREKIFDHIWVQPAAGDAGGSLGAALFYYYQVMGNKRIVDGKTDLQKGTYLGPSYDETYIGQFLEENQYVYHKYDNQQELFEKIAEYISSENVIGLCQGRMEFGPRALGNRSIIADARSETMQSKLNLKIKYRESFRPFAPSVLKERASDYFEIECQSPYMLMCADVTKERRLEFDVNKSIEESHHDLLHVINKKRSDIPAVTHIDYSARIQTVDELTNPFYYGVIKSLENKTGCGVIINTSFNVRGEPIVCTPQDAYRCFMRTDMDILVLENFILIKSEQPQWMEEKDWREEYALD